MHHRPLGARLASVEGRRFHLPMLLRGAADSQPVRSDVKRNGIAQPATGGVFSLNQLGCRNCAGWRATGSEE